MKTKPVTFLFTFHNPDAPQVVFARGNGIDHSHALTGASAKRLHRLLFTLIDRGWRLEPNVTGGYFAWPPRLGVTP